LTWTTNDTFNQSLYTRVSVAHRPAISAGADRLIRLAKTISVRAALSSEKSPRGFSAGAGAVKRYHTAQADRENPFAGGRRNNARGL
jgi:hypothetical protein